MRWPDDASLVRALRAGDEAAFAQLVDTHSGALISLAQSYVPTRALAEEVVQETWIGVIRGIGRFEGRSALKTWIYRILVNIAKTRGRRERRTVPFSSAVGEAEAAGGELVDAERFFRPDHRWAGHWAAPPE